MTKTLSSNVKRMVGRANKYLEEAKALKDKVEKGKTLDKEAHRLSKEAGKLYKIASEAV